MKKITTAADLKLRITELELQSCEEKAALKSKAHEVRESLTPANLIKNTVKDVVGAPGMKGKLLGAVLGLAAGYFAKKALFGVATSPLKKIAGNLLQMGLAGTVTKNTDGLRTLGANLLQRLFKRRKKGFKEILDNVDQL